ncbi:unnamed protein product [Symbiodinium microadriaticum]|nr:unnamed protein product [Symbiodinium microadriaticum]
MEDANVDEERRQREGAKTREPEQGRGIHRLLRGRCAPWPTAGKFLMRLVCLTAFLGSLSLVHSATNAEWGNSINMAGMQRTLSQRMSKEFLLVSLGIDTGTNKVKLQQSVRDFNNTLHALITGDPVQGIVAAPNAQVAANLQEVLSLWVPFETLLTSSVDSVRSADGSINIPVLEAVSSQNGPLLDASNVVVGGLVDAAKVAGASTNGLVQDIAGRQRTYIQSLCLKALLISQGVSLSSNKASLKETKLLFEDSHTGIIEGVPFAGVPVLTNMCTLHQMSEVTYYYSSFRPLVNEILNAHTVQSSQQTALRLAPNIANLTEPLFDSMVLAVQFFNNKSMTCDPVSSMSDEDWRSFIDTLGKLRLETQQVSQYFMQVALGSNVHTSKVEITVMISTALQQVRSLLEGRKAEGIPAPPTQGVVDQMLIAAETWSVLETELTQAVRAEAVTPIMVDRVALLSADVLDQLSTVMEMTVQEAWGASPATPAYLMDLTSKQSMRLFKMSKEASLAHYGVQVDANWMALNATRDAFVAAHRKLLLGAPAQNATPALQQLSQLCIIQRMREVDDFYQQLQESALAVAHGSFEAMAELSQFDKRALDAMSGASKVLVSGACENATTEVVALLLAWLELHQEAADLSRLSQDATAAFVIAQEGGGGSFSSLSTAAEDVKASFHRLMFGSWKPHVAAPPTQALLEHVMSTVEPAVERFTQALSGTDVLNVEAAGVSLLGVAEVLQAKYLKGARESDPMWPGARVDVLMSQAALASRVHKEALLHVYGFRKSDAELSSAISEFETSHQHLKDGGGGLEPVIAERKDILEQWEQINQAWLSLKSQARSATSEDTWRVEDAMTQVISQIQVAIPLYGMEDVEAPESFPWTSAIYIRNKSRKGSREQPALSLNCVWLCALAANFGLAAGDTKDVKGIPFYTPTAISNSAPPMPTEEVLISYGEETSVLDDLETLRPETRNPKDLTQIMNFAWLGYLSFEPC